MTKDPATGFVRYLGLLLNRAAQKSVLLTDRLTILIVPFVTLIVWATGTQMTDSIQETMFLVVAIIVLSVGALRLIAASYLLWKDDQSKIEQLQQELDAPVTREAAALWKHRVRLRKELGDCLGWLITFAEYAALNSDNPTLIDDMFPLSKYYDKYVRAREIISQLSYDVYLRVMCLNLLGLTTQVVQAHDDQEKAEKLIARLWTQRKLTFKFLHRQDVHELFTLAEVENLIAEYGEDFGEGSDALRELRETIAKNPSIIDDNAVSIRSLMAAANRKTIKK